MNGLPLFLITKKTVETRTSTLDRDDIVYTGQSSQSSTIRHGSPTTQFDRLCKPAFMVNLK